jgi:hypothetical protein
LIDHEKERTIVDINGGKEKKEKRRADIPLLPFMN